MKRFLSFWLALGLLLVTGCARDSGVRNFAPPPAYDPYAQIDFDELLNFGANMAGISASARTDVCRTLLKSDKGSSDVGIQLHLLIGRLFSDDCGDIATILDSINAIPAGNLRDEKTQKLVAIHAEALKRMQAPAKKTASSERKPKSTPTSTSTAADSKESAAAKKDEARLLREKLEAIRSMEKQLDETGNDK